jgi:hypothetical protein
LNCFQLVNHLLELFFARTCTRLITSLTGVFKVSRTFGVTVLPATCSARNSTEPEKWSGSTATVNLNNKCVIQFYISVKEYAWGKRGPASEVARLFAAGHKHFQVGPKTPYAELWMGTHPDGAASVRGTNERLSRLIAQSDLASYLVNNNDNQANRDEIHLPFIM